MNYDSTEHKAVFLICNLSISMGKVGAYKNSNHKVIVFPVFSQLQVHIFSLYSQGPQLQ